MSCDLPGGERSSLQPCICRVKFFHERSHCAWARSPAGGSRVTANTHSASQQHQHAPQGPACTTTTLLRELPALEKPGSGLFLLSACLAHFLLCLLKMLRLAEPGRHELQFQMCLLRATMVLLTPNLILKDENLFFSPNAEIVTGLLLQIISH